MTVKTYYIVSQKKLPKIEKDDPLVAHIQSRSDRRLQIFPEINNISIKKESPALDNYTNPIFIYKLEIFMRDAQIHTLQYKNENFHFHLSHHSKQARDYEKEHSDEMSFLHPGPHGQHLVWLRLHNDVKGILYESLDDAIAEMDREIIFRAIIAKESKEHRKKQYEKLKKEFES